MMFDEEVTGLKAESPNMLPVWAMRTEVAEMAARHYSKLTSLRDLTCAAIGSDVFATGPAAEFMKEYEAIISKYFDAFKAGITGGQGPDSYTGDWIH